MIRFVPILLLMGCAEIKMPQPISFPSVCMGDEHCERNKNAATLAQIGFEDAALFVMCYDSGVRRAMGAECGDDLQF